MSITTAELRAAKEFRDVQRAALEQKGKTDITVSALIRHYRHDCAARGGKSLNLELREHYVFSPDYYVQGPEVGNWKAGAAMGFPRDRVRIPAGRFGFIYTEGRCAACGMTARSGDSRLVDTAVRPPAPRAVITGR